MSLPDLIIIGVVVAVAWMFFAWRQRLARERAAKETARRELEAYDRAQEERRQRLGRLFAQFDDV